jgi:hypothetical protein
MTRTDPSTSTDNCPSCLTHTDSTPHAVVGASGDAPTNPPLYNCLLIHK